MTQFVFEQIGGRCKLVMEDSCRRCTSEEIAESYRLKWSRLLAEKEARRGMRSRRKENWKLVQTFLESRKFKKDDVNAAKFTYCGFVRSYPLHEAAKEMNWRVMVCLMKFGANPSQKDSRNKRAIDYVPVECLEALTLESLTT